jgi:hypothetical protein
MSTYTTILQTIASLTGIATSTSMFIAYRQLKLASRNSQLTFEDALAREFRQVATRVPLAALLGDDLASDKFSDVLPTFYWYFDLSDEQVFQRRFGRVSDVTWANWSAGIHATMRRPAFARAFAEITARMPEAFPDLRAFIAESPQTDPQGWSVEPELALQTAT